MHRKSIVVCVTGYNREYESKIVEGARLAAMAADINLLVYAPLTHKADEYADKPIPESIVRSETEIFRLLAYHKPDGIIMMGDSFVDPDVADRISAAAADKGVPVVNVDDPHHTAQYNVMLNETTAMEIVMRHLINEHGCRKIDFIGGFVGNRQSEERLMAYKKVLTEAGIPIEPERIAYGEFWIKARGCTERLLEFDKPDAIVCASDVMAFFCMDVLSEKGLRVPDDILVTGFDDIADCELYTPPLTSIHRDYVGAGEKAVEIIRGVWDKKSFPSKIVMESKLIKRCSCGCASMEHSGYYDKRYAVVNSYKAFNSNLIEMNTSFADVHTAQELFECTKTCAKFFELKRLYFCICNGVGKIRDILPDDIQKGENSGLTSLMVSMLKYGHNIACGTRFPTSKLVPEDVFSEDKAVFFGFCPLYSNDRFIGYAAFEPSKIKGQGDLFGTWLNSVSSNAASFYMRNVLSIVAGRLSDLYIRDPLTALYNRRGLDTLGERMLRRASDSRCEITAVCADVDRLKPINDTYGHEGGDNAISRVACAIRESMPENSICARTGGDEFTVMIMCDAQTAARSLESVERALSKYNDESGLPYKVGCSCGTFTALLSDMQWDDIVKRADEEMYRVKNLRKTQRVG